MALRLDALTAYDCEQVLDWRHQADTRPGLRTALLLTREMQQEFYEQVVCDRASPHRYWALRDETDLVGMVGLTHIQWENGLAEISLLVDPGFQGKGVGREAVRLVLQEAFRQMRLKTVVGECYQLNDRAVEFWRKITEAHDGTWTTLPRRKWWDGRLWDSLYFSIPQPSWLQQP